MDQLLKNFFGGVAVEEKKEGSFVSGRRLLFAHERRRVGCRDYGLVTMILLVFCFFSMVIVNDNHSNVVEGLKVVNFSYEVIEYEYFGKPFGLAVSTTEFDKDVYLVDALVCPYDEYRYTYLEQQQSSTECPPCNYAKKSRCGISPKKGCKCPPEEVKLYCKGEKKETWIVEHEKMVEVGGNHPLLDWDDWEELKPNVKLENQTIEAGRSLYYRYYHSSFMTGFRVNVRPMYGSTTFLASRYSPFPSRFDYNVSYPAPNGPNNQLVCPAFPSFYPGTWYIAIQATVPSVFNIEIEIENTTRREHLDAPCPGPELDTNKCIVDGQTVTGTTTTYFVFYATECKPVTFSVVNNNSADFDLYLSFSSPTPFTGNYDLVSYLWGDDQITLAICDEDSTSRKNKKPIPIYINVQRYLEGEYWFTVTSDDDAIIYTQLGDIQETTYINRAVNTVNVTCGPGQFCPCGDPYATCTQFWPVFPWETAVPFFPIPPIARLERNFQLIRSFNPSNELINQTANRRIFRAASLMSQGDKNQLFTSKTIQKCVYTFLGRLVDEDGFPVNTKVSLDEKNIKVIDIQRFLVNLAQKSECDPEIFLATNERVNALVKELQFASSTTEVNELRFEIETYLTAPTYYACLQRFSELYNVTTKNERMSTIACTLSSHSEDYPNDPCCNPISAGWETVCYPSERNVQVDVPKIQHGELWDVCQTPTCSNIVLDSDLKIKRQLDSEINFCGIETTLEEQVIADFLRIQTVDIYINCKNEVLGFSGIGIDCPFSAETPSCRGYQTLRPGIRCYEDSDCVDIGKEYYDYIAECDQVNKICKYKRKDQEKALLSCLLRNMPTSVLSFLKSRYKQEYELSEDRLVQSFLKIWSAKDCVEEYGFALSRRQSWYYATIGPNYAKLYPQRCGTSVRLDPLSEVGGDTCRDTNDYGYWYSETSAPGLCEGDSYYCNWASCDGLTEEECKTLCKETEGNDYFCGYCSNELNCTVISSYTNKKQCEQAEVCVLSDGTVRPDLTPEECVSIGECTQPCGYKGEVCQTKSECEERGGYCDGWYYLVNPHSPDTDGNCFTSYLSYDLSASQYGSYEIGAEVSVNIFSYCMMWVIDSYYTPAGCINYNATSEYECYQAYQENQDLTAYYDAYIIPPGPDHYIWKPIPKTKSECLDYVQCKQRVFNSRSFLQTRYNSKNRTDCEFAGGDYGPVFSWTDGKWITGKMKPLKWIKKGFDFEYKWKSTLNFTHIATDINHAIDFLITSQTTTDAICRYSQTPNLQNTVFCDCFADNEPICDQLQYRFDSKSDEYQLRIPQIVVYVCSGQNETIQQLSFIIYIQDNSIDKDCQIVYVYFVPIYQFQQIQQLRVSSSIVPMPEYGEFDVVRNSYGYIIGQLLGDGVRIEDSGIELKNITICFVISQPRSSDDYDTIDIARLESHGFFEPLGLTGYTADYPRWGDDSSTKLACITIPSVIGCDNSSNSPCTLFPILRRYDYETVDNYYSTTELGFFYTIAGLYFICTIAAGLQLLYIAINPNCKFLLQNIVQFVLVIVTVVRGVYFVSLGTIHVFQDHDMANFVFILSPTLLQLTLLSLNVLIWAVHSLKLKIPFPIPVVIVNTIVYGLFVLCIILFEVLPTSETNGCGGRASVTTDETGKKVVKAFFFSALVGIATVLLSGMLIFGSRIFAALKRVGTKVALIYRIFVLAFVFGLSVIIMSIYLLIITFTTFPPVYLTFSLLLAIEVGPFFLLFQVLDPFKHNRRTKSLADTHGTSIAKLRELSDTNTKVQSVATLQSVRSLESNNSESLEATEPETEEEP